MNRIFLRGWSIDNLKNDTLYQIDYKQAYIKRQDNNIYIYSYKTCILEIDTKNNVFYNNMNKYSHTTGKQKNYILRHLNLSNYQEIKVKPQHNGNGYYMILQLDNLHDQATKI